MVKKQIDSKMVCLVIKLILQWQNSGLPVAIAALQILNGKLNSRRTTSNYKEVYLPILKS
jgi:hypothetical protein